MEFREKYANTSNNSEKLRALQSNILRGELENERGEIILPLSRDDVRKKLNKGLTYQIIINISNRL